MPKSDSVYGDPIVGPVTVTDKRGGKKKPKAEIDPLPEKPPLPTAQELLDATTEIEHNREHDAHHAEEEQRRDTESEFDRQRAEAEEDARRSAEFDALPEEEKQRVLAEQAANVEGIPYAGAGVQTGGETKKEVLAAYITVIDLDGTALAMPLSEFDPDKYEVQRDEPTTRMIYRACAEIMLDIQSAEAATMTLQMQHAVGEKMMAQQRARALQQQLSQRGRR